MFVRRPQKLKGGMKVGGILPNESLLFKAFFIIHILIPPFDASDLCGFSEGFTGVSFESGVP